MDNLQTLYNTLKEQLELYNSYLELEKEKYNVIIRDDVIELDKIVSQEQVFFLKSRGLEAKRESVLKKMNMQGKTLKEVVDLIDENERDKFLDIHKKIYSILTAFKEKNDQCKDLVQIRLHRAQTMINKLDEGNINNKQYFKDGNTGEIDINKVNLISKKV